MLGIVLCFDFLRLRMLPLCLAHPVQIHYWLIYGSASSSQKALTGASARKEKKKKRKLSEVVNLFLFFSEEEEFLKTFNLGVYDMVVIINTLNISMPFL